MAALIKRKMVRRKRPTGNPDNEIDRQELRNDNYKFFLIGGKYKYNG